MSRTAVYRFFNTITDTHFYTASETERDIVIGIPQFQFEGTAFFAEEEQVDGTAPVYRFFNLATGTHFYTISEEERQSVQENLPQFQFEGIAYYANTEPTGDSIPLFRSFNTETSAHFYTASENEHRTVLDTLDQFSGEGVGYYVFPDSTPPQPEPVEMGLRLNGPSEESEDFFPPLALELTFSQAISDSDAERVKDLEFFDFGGVAFRGQDYDVSLSSEQDSRIFTFDVSVFPDANVESQETARVSLVEMEDFTIEPGRSSVLFTILNDDFQF